MSTGQSPHLSCIWEDARDWDSLKVSEVPDEPGFYAFTDYDDKQLAPSNSGKTVLYVGIATGKLRDRIRKYKSGDTAGVAHLHRGGFLMLLSRADAVHAGREKLTHTVQRTPVEVVHKRGSTVLRRSQILPQKIYLRWSVDYRAAIESLLIRQLHPKYNTMHNQP